MITVEQLELVMTSAPASRLALYVDPLNEAMADWYIDEKKLRVAMFLAQLAHESAELKSMRENLNYSAAGLRATFPSHFTEAQARAYERQPERIASRVYAGRFGNGDEASGDGWCYRGGGGFQITFHDNYRDASDAMFEDDRLLQQPETVELPEIAIDISGWFWCAHGMNEVADGGNFDATTRILNGGQNGFLSRRTYYARALLL